MCPDCLLSVPMPGQCLLTRTVIQPCRFVKHLWGEDASTCTVAERLHDPAWWKMMKETWKQRSMEGMIRTVMRSPKPQQRNRKWRNSPTANSTKFCRKLTEKIRKRLYLHDCGGSQKSFLLILEFLFHDQSVERPQAGLRLWYAKRLHCCMGSEKAFLWKSNSEEEFGMQKSKGFKSFISVGFRQYLLPSAPSSGSLATFRTN